MVHVMATIIVKPEHAAAAKQMLVELASTTRSEPGCVAYELYQRPDALHEFHTMEQWKSQADVDAHMKTPHIAAAMARGGPMFASPPAIHVIDKIG